MAKQIVTVNRLNLNYLRYKVKHFLLLPHTQPGHLEQMTYRKHIYSLCSSIGYLSNLRVRRWNFFTPYHSRVHMYVRPNKGPLEHTSTVCAAGAARVNEALFGAFPVSLEVMKS